MIGGLTRQRMLWLEKTLTSGSIIAGSFKSQLIDYSDLPVGYGEGLRGAFGSFMIIRPSLFKYDWSLFSIWNGVIVINLSG